MANHNPQNQFKKGQSGNPRGAPHKDFTWKHLLTEAVEEKDEHGEPFKNIIVRKVIALAMNGNMTAMRETMDRMDGKPKQGIDMASDEKSLRLPQVWIPKEEE